jgi:Cu/Zn superoxide dismutase
MHIGMCALTFKQPNMSAPTTVKASIAGLDGNPHGFHVHQVNQPVYAFHSLSGVILEMAQLEIQ